MSDGKNPFSEKAAQPADEQPNFSRLPWVAAVGAAVAAVVFLVGWYNALGKAHALEGLPAKLRAANDALNGSLADNAKLATQITDLQKNVADLEQEKNQATQAARGLEDEMRTALESKDVTISKLQGKLTVSILDRVLFDSGEADLKPAGEAVMQKIAALLAAHPALKIHVIGHTDNVPIAANARSRFASNWELSSVRALAAVHFLTERAGVDARRVGGVGYGEFRPVAENNSPEGRARNRRIEVVILPDELAAPENAPGNPGGK